MNNKNLQRNQILILLALLVIISIANYINYYGPKRVKVMEDFSTLSDKEKDYYTKHNKYIKISEDATFDENGKLIAQNVSKDNLINGSNYLKHAVTPDGKIARWNKKTIKYYYQDKTGFYSQFIKQATETYNELFKNYFKLENTNDKNNADIIISVKPRFDVSEKSNEVFMLGLTNTYLNEKNNIEKARITLIYNIPNTNRSISGEEMYKVALHELGHAIGISGHSDNPEDIMYQTLSQTGDTLSQRDRVTVKMLYSNNVKVLNKQIRNAKRVKIDEAKEYAKISMGSNETMALINLAQTYFENDKKEKALETYKKAIAKDPNNHAIYKSMGECYYFSKKYETALKYFNKSYSLSNGTSDVGEILNMIGVTYAKLNDYENAYENFYKAYSADKDNYEILQNLVASCIKTNKKSEALMYISGYIKSGHSISEDEFMKKAYSWAKS